MSWAPYASRSLSPSIRVWTLRRAVNGGRTATSVASKSLPVSMNASFWVSASASKWLLCIFQLPATSGFLAAVRLTVPPARLPAPRPPARSPGCPAARWWHQPVLGSLQGREPRQRPALEILEAGPAARRDVRERALGKAERAHGRGGVPAADHRQAGHVADRLGHRAR